METTMPNYNAQSLFDMVSGMKCTVTLGKRAGTPVALTESLADFPLVAIEKMIRYGFQRGVNDPVGGKDVTLEAKLSGAKALIARWKAGEVGRAPSESVDPVRDVARDMAKAIFRKKDLAGWNAFITESKATADKSQGKIKIGSLIDARLDTIIAKNPKLLVDAQAELDRRAENVDSIDLSL